MNAAPQRRALTVGQARGWRYGPIPEEVGRALPRWMDEGRVSEGEELKPGRVYRLGEWLVKLFPERRGLAGIVRGSRALRSAELHRRLLPVRTPRPLLALQGRSGSFEGRGLLVTEFVHGRFLSEVWDDDEHARAALPPFMAGMHALSVLHGDLNVRNLLWTGEEWVLIDLDGIRNPLHGLAPRRIIENQWGRLLGLKIDQPGTREAFDEYLRLAQPGWEPDQAWQRVEAIAREYRALWREKLRRRARGEHVP